MAKHEIFGRRLFDYLDTGESVQRSYGVFLSKIPGDYGGVAGVTIADGKLTVSERGTSADRWSDEGQRDLVFAVDGLPLP